MSRTGVEAKPPWSAAPESVRFAVGAVLGAPVARAERVYGGYSPTPTFRLRLVNGGHAFFKASVAGVNPFAEQALIREERVYRELPELIGPWAPAFLGSFALDDWRVLLLEDVGPRSVPPWTSSLARQVMQATAQFHASTLGLELPDWVARGDNWRELGLAYWREATGLAATAGMAGAAAGRALGWLMQAAPQFRKAEANLTNPRQVLLHSDTRSDNLRWRAGRLYLLDWPSVMPGAPEDDLAAFAQSIALEDGPSPEQLVAWYAERLPVDDRALDAALVAVCGYFATVAPQPELPLLPRLRAFQRAQLRVSLTWAARRFGLPSPDWLTAMP